MSVDPLTQSYPWYTPYQFAGNKPIWATDLDGLEEKIYQSEIKNDWGFQVSLKIANSTIIGQEFNKELLSQNKIDVYYFVFDSKELLSSGEIVDAVQYSSEGFASGTLGRTALVSNMDELRSMMENDYVMQFVTPSDLQKSFDQGKSVVLIGIAKQLIKVPYKFSLEKQKNLRISSSEVIIHEQDAHALNRIKGTDKSPKEEHKDYHGDYSTSSPSVEDLFTEKKYEKTRGRKAAEQAKTVVNKIYPKKK